MRARITRTYRRTAYALRVLTLRDTDGCEQTLRVTEEHPFHVEHESWTPAKLLVVGDVVLGDTSKLTVVANVFEPHAEGVTVYNLEVAEAHTYFVRAEGDDDAQPVWVHNADYVGRTGKQPRLRALVDDPLVSRADRGWIKQELNQIARGKRRTIRLPGSSRRGNSGKVLAHRRGKEARLGFGYEHADLQDIELHKIQHQYEGYR